MKKNQFAAYFLGLLGLLMAVSSCSKSDKINMDQLTTGTWEYFNNDPNLAMDSSLRYIFTPNGRCKVEISTFVAPYDTVYEQRYVVSAYGNYLTFYPVDGDVYTHQYEIQKLTSKKMTWKSEDPSEEYLHFVKVD